MRTYARERGSQGQPGAPGLRSLLKYIDSRARSGVPISTTEAFDLTQIWGAGRGVSAVPHVKVAEAIGRSYSQVQRQRARYGDPSLHADPDAGVLLRRSGARPKGRERPTEISLLLQRLVDDDQLDEPGPRPDAVQRDPDAYVDPEQEMRELMLARFERRVAAGDAAAAVEEDIRIDADAGAYGPWHVGGAVDDLFFASARDADAPCPRHLAARPSDDPPSSYRPQGSPGGRDGAAASDTDATEEGTPNAQDRPRSSGQDAAPHAGGSSNVSGNVNDTGTTEQGLPSESRLSAPDQHEGPSPRQAVNNGLEGAGCPLRSPTGAARNASDRRPPGRRASLRARLTANLHTFVRPELAGADRREDLAQAAVVRKRLIELQLLHSRRVASVGQLADALCQLRTHYASRNKAARIVAAALQSTPREGAASGTSRTRGGRGFPGYAFFLALQPGVAARSPWWLEGVERAWNGAPDWRAQPGWRPITEPTPELTRYDDDAAPVELRELWLQQERRNLEIAREAELDRLWAKRKQDAGNLSLWAIRSGQLPWDAMCVLEEWGGDFIRTVKRKQRAARDGSAPALEVLNLVDLAVQRMLDKRAEEKRKVERVARRLAERAANSRRAPEPAPGRSWRLGDIIGGAR